MAFHDILGALLASAAVILAIYVFKRTTDFQAYRELDLNYMDVLKIGIENPYLRDPEWIKGEYKTISCQKKTGCANITDAEKVLKYDEYAYMVWNICETIYDRNKADKTWSPVLATEKKLHLEWLKDPKNWSKFKQEFRDFIIKTEFGIVKDP